LESFAEQQNATLERVFIAILRPHGKVHCHFDAGTYFATKGRYHLVLHSEGTRVQIENDEAVFHQGEIWWFCNWMYHEFSHNSTNERMHLIFDMHPRSFFKRLKYASVWSYLYLIHKIDGASKTGSPLQNKNAH
jgi:hypothetical protein